MEVGPDLETDSHRPFLLLFWTCGWSFLLRPDRQTYTPPHPNMPLKLLPALAASTSSPMTTPLASAA